jgi:hypothetical protein
MVRPDNGFKLGENGVAAVSESDQWFIENRLIRIVGHSVQRTGSNERFYFRLDQFSHFNAGLSFWVVLHNSPAYYKYSISMSANVEILKSFLLSRERQGFSIPVQARIYLYYFLDSSFRWNDKAFLFF